MSSQNRFLLPHSGTSTLVANTSSGGPSASTSSAPPAGNSMVDDQENQLSVDTDFDLYWEEEARNPQRNRIRIGRQYQATVPALLKPGESDQRDLAELETLTFCPRRSANVSDAELEHYFTVAKSLNLFASLVETRTLLGRDVTIADLNHITNKEGLSLASVIQPNNRQSVYVSSSQSSSSQQQQQVSTSSTTASKSSPVKSPQSLALPQDQKPSSSTSVTSPGDSTAQQSPVETCAINRPLMRALSHFISLHHPCHHDQDCKKLNKELPLEEEPSPAVSITATNLRQTCSNSPVKGRSRSSLKQQQAAAAAAAARQVEETTENNSNQDQDHALTDNASQSASYDEWTREEIELFSKAIEVCGKNFGSIKKEFLPTKSVRSIVEYYYIGSRDVSESKKKPSQNLESGDSCNSPDKNQPSFSGGSGSNDEAGDACGPSSSASSHGGKNNVTSASSSRQAGNSSNESQTTTKSSSDNDKLMSSSNQKACSGSKMKAEISNNCTPPKNSGSSKSKTNSKNIDARMSVYNFDDEFKDDNPVKLECPTRPGAEVKPLKAKPIVPNAALDNEAGNSNVGSLKFFMDGQLVLKLNACQDQQEGADKCHWVQSGEKLLSQNRNKRYSKRANSDNRAPSEQSPNGSYSNSVLSSNNDDDSKNEDLSLDEDSKESANSFSNTNTPQRPKKQLTPKRSKPNKSNEVSPSTASNLAPSPIDYNRLAINNRIKERADNSSQQSSMATSPLMATNAAPTMPNWLQANQFAMAAAILGGLPFPAAAAAAAAGNIIQNINNNNNTNNGHNHHILPPANNIAVNMATSKPMDLSLEHSAPKPISSKSSSRSRSKQKN